MLYVYSVIGRYLAGARCCAGLLALLLVVLAGCGDHPPAAQRSRSTPPALEPALEPAPVPPRATSLTVVAAGDLLVHEALTAQAAADAVAAGCTPREPRGWIVGEPLDRGLRSAPPAGGSCAGHDFRAVLGAVAPVVRAADLAICHMEQPLATPDGPFTGWPLFSAPPELADAAADAGFDTCSTASNHSLDTGLPGLARTLDNLDRVGVAHTGTARTRREAGTPNLLRIRGVPVAHLSYTANFNGIPLPAGRAWTANQIDPDRILAEARRARRAGAEIVIASLHWGTEYQVAPDFGQLALAQDLLAGPELDLIIGHHAHVVQPFERIGDKWVAYGLGNLTTRFPDGSPERTQDSVVPRFTFTETSPGNWRVSAVEVVATWMEYYPAARVVNLPAALADPATDPQRRDRYQRILERISGYVDLRGAVADGLRMVPPDRS